MAQLAVSKNAFAARGPPTGADRAAKYGLPRARRCCDGRHWPILKEDVRSCREVSVNSGGEPERDDTGLPPVDIEIPDDARELDRDVQAYYREQRAERRRLRHRRLHSRITRDGIVLPLLACCLILALITGTLLTVFTATSDQNPAPSTRSPASQRPASGGPASSAPASSAASGSAAPRAPSTSPASSPASAVDPRVQTGAPLPAGTLVLEATNLQVPLRTLTLHETILVLVPAACRCGATVSWLANIAARDTVTTYLVGTPQTIGEVNHLHSQLPGNLQRAATVALDSHSVLSHAYRVRGLTAVLVPRRLTGTQSAAYAQDLSAADSAAPLLRALTG